jgi:DMSO/TMAO reductase YedYZ molybdopterin-dependent catalytic subunit
MPHGRCAYVAGVNLRETMSTENSFGVTRRSLLRQSFLCGSAWICGTHHLQLPWSFLPRTANAPGDGSLLAVVPFSDEGRPPMGELIGTGLDGRLFTDLSTLTPENPVTPADKFFIRTRASKLLETSNAWTIHVAGRIAKPIAIPAEVLAKKARPMGIHLMECSGNARSAHFGMISVAAWDGVSLEEILETAKPQRSVVRVLVSGFDRYEEESMTSEPGASWIFRPDQLFSSKAFLATKMNGQPLPADHGAPVRLVVPGWYGCVSVKWVNQIEFVADDAPATSQMREYAGRTMQMGVPSLARDYLSAIVDIAAMPTRIEKWLVGGKIRYQVTGIQWGGSAPSHAIEIRFDPGERFVPVENMPSAPGNSWCFWTHQWSPPRTGRFTLSLRLNAPNIAARRLNAGYYDRSVDIAEISGNS